MIRTSCVSSLSAYQRPSSLAEASFGSATDRAIPGLSPGNLEVVPCLRSVVQKPGVHRHIGFCCVSSWNDGASSRAATEPGMTQVLEYHRARGPFWCRTQAGRRVMTCAGFAHWQRSSRQGPGPNLHRHWISAGCGCSGSPGGRALAVVSIGGPPGTRTPDQEIKSLLLYQLS